MTKNIFVSQIGARMHYAVPLALHNKGMLAGFNTDFVIKHNSTKSLIKLFINSKQTIAKKFLGRQLPVPAKLISTHFSFFFRYNLSLKRSKNLANLAHIFYSYGLEFSKKAISSCNSFSNSTVIYSYCRESFFLFKKFKNIKRLILEQYILPRQLMDNLLQEEQKIWPSFELQIDENYIEQSKNLYEIEMNEWNLSDLILCPSEYVKNGLITINPNLKNKIVVLPYSYDKKSCELTTFSKKKRVLFVGEVGIRKGAHYLILASKCFDDNVEFIFAGRITLPRSFLETEAGHNCKFLGVIQRNSVENLYKSASVFVLPSLCEGSATVLYEAMSFGIPIICSENSGAPFTMQDHGIITKIRDVEAIVNSLNTLLFDENKWNEFSQGALNCVKNLSFAHYSEKLTHIINSKLE